MLTRWVLRGRRGWWAGVLAPLVLWAAPVQADSIGLGLATLPALWVEAGSLRQAHRLSVGAELSGCTAVDVGEPRVGFAVSAAWLATCHDGSESTSSWQARASAAADLMPVLLAAPGTGDPRPELAGGALALAALATVLRLNRRRPSD